MGTPTLDGTDRAILERLAAGRPASELGETVDGDDIEERLAALVESGLVARTDEGYELADSGRRVLAAPGDTTADDRIDVPDRVEGAIERADPPPERAAAIRSAFAFLAYWGEASDYEIRDAVYSERPAGYGSVTEWWNGFVRDALADLPDVAPPPSDGHVWRYEGPAGVEDPTADGRHGPGESDDAAYASVKHALESLDLQTEEREAAHAAFASLADRESATAEEITEAVYPNRPAGYGSAEEWWDRMEGVLEELPGIERDGEVWRYRNAVDDVHSPGGGPHVSAADEPMGTDDPGVGTDRASRLGDEDRDA